MCSFFSLVTLHYYIALLVAMIYDSNMKGAWNYSKTFICAMELTTKCWVTSFIVWWFSKACNFKFFLKKKNRSSTVPTHSHIRNCIYEYAKQVFCWIICCPSCCTRNYSSISISLATIPWYSRFSLLHHITLS